MDDGVRLLNESVEKLTDYLDLDGPTRRAIATEILKTLSDTELSSVASEIKHRPPPHPASRAEIRSALAATLSDPELRTRIAGIVWTQIVRRNGHVAADVPTDHPPAAEASDYHARPLDLVTIRVTPSFWNYNLISIASGYRHLFPGYREEFQLVTDVDVFDVRITSASRGTPTGDPTAGRQLRSVHRNELARWFNHHPNLAAGDTITIEVLDPMCLYELKLLDQ